MRNFIIRSTFLGLFSSNLYFYVGAVHYLYFYFLVFSNLVLLWLVGSLWLPRGLFVFLGFLLLSGTFGILRGTGSVVGFSKAFLGILPTAIYFCAFFRYMKFDVERCFALYARLAYHVALFGIAYIAFQPASGHTRLTSVLEEPSGFCAICIPALFYYADQWQRNRQYGWRGIVILTAFVLTYSSLGYLGILLGLYLFGTRFRFGTLLMPGLVLAAGIGIYNTSSFFRLRLDDSLQSLATEDMTESNASSFGVISNVFVTREEFLEHPFTGGGLGSHVVAHDRFAPQLVGIEVFDQQGAGDLGRWEASSLFLRIISETGLIGLAYTIWFLWHCWPRHGSATQRGIAMALLTYVFLKFLRSGSYFDPEEFFFFLLYAVNGLHARRERWEDAVSHSISGRDTRHKAVRLFAEKGLQPQENGRLLNAGSPHSA